MEAVRRLIADLCYSRVSLQEPREGNVVQLTQAALTILEEERMSRKPDQRLIVLLEELIRLCYEVADAGDPLLELDLRPAAD